MGIHVHGLAWHSDGRSFAAALAPDGSAPSGAASRVAIFNATTFQELTSLATRGHQPFCCAFSPDGRLLAAGGGSTDRDADESKANCVVRVWDLPSGAVVAELQGHTGLIRDLAFWPDTRRLLTAGWDNTVRAWDLTATNELPESH